VALLVGFRLLDRQILDRDGNPVGKVDDVELAPGDDGVPTVVALLVGPVALGQRMGGRLGRWIAGVAHRLHPAEEPRYTRIAWERVERVTSAVYLNISRDLLPEPVLETWLRDHLVDNIPGAGHEGA